MLTVTMMKCLLESHNQEQRGLSQRLTNDPWKAPHRLIRLVLPSAQNRVTNDFPLFSQYPMFSWFGAVADSCRSVSYLHSHEQHEVLVLQIAHKAL